MPARTLPLSQDPFRGADPSPLKVARVVYGGDTFCRSDVQPDTSAATASNVLFTVPPGVIIYDIGWRVLESFTNAGAVTLGVDTDASTFATAAQLGATDAADAHIIRMSVNNATASTATGVMTPIDIFHSGEVVDTGEASITIIADKAAVALDAGSLEIYLFYFDNPAGAGT